MSFTYRLITQNNPLYSKLIKLRYERLWKPLKIITPHSFEEEEKNSVFIVALVKSRTVAGAVALTNEPNNNWIRLRQLVVATDYEKQGIGTELINQAVAFAQSQNVRRIALFAFEEVYPFFEKNGFTTYSGWYTHINRKRSILMMRAV